MNGTRRSITRPMVSIAKASTHTAIIAAVLLGSIASSVAQYNGIPQPYPCWVLKVRIGQGGGSGFLLHASNSVYIATARHVLFNTIICSDGLCFTNIPSISTTSPCTTNYFLISTNAIFSACYPDQPAGRETREIDVDLQKLLERDELRYSAIHDVALVWIEECDPQNAQVFKYDTNVVHFLGERSFGPLDSNHCKRMNQVDVGAETFSAGFSSSFRLSQIANTRVEAKLPLLRKGIVAGIYKDSGLLVLDSKAYGGDSGGPVVMKNTRYDILPAQTDVFVIGLLIEVVPGLENWQQLGNSGFSIVEPMDAILDMVWR